ncbi:hypothetical protein EAF00_011857 [Botryotinia globosa]|nr:hypothetical protein EAF00_011857 [Botryotinia globosa]
MNGQDYEIAKDIPSRSSSLDSGSKSQKDSTDRIEPDEGFKTLSSKTEELERHGSTSTELYQAHSFDHVLEGPPWSNTRPSSKLCVVCQIIVDDIRNPLSLRISAQNDCSFCAILIHNDGDEEKKRDGQISRYID